MDERVSVCPSGFLLSAATPMSRDNARARVSRLVARFARSLALVAVVAGCGARASDPRSPELPAAHRPVVEVAPPDPHAAPAAGNARAPTPQRASEEDIAACQERVLREYVSSAASDPVEGGELARVASEERANGDLRAARTHYFELVQKYPRSPYVPFAYFAFGEMFMREATSDPSKAPLAAAAYGETVKYPAPLSRMYLLARVHLAKSLELAEDAPSAQKAYQRALDEAIIHSDWDCAAAVEKAARLALAPGGRSNVP